MGTLLHFFKRRNRNLWQNLDSNELAVAINASQNSENKVLDISAYNDILNDGDSFVWI